MRKHSKQIALGGVMAALAVTIMSLGGLIPVATYVCPVLCCLLLHTVLQSCGSRIAWAWYGAVAILSLLMSPDKEAAAVFVFLGYYPIIKPNMDKLPVCRLWKALFFNAVILSMYWMMIHLFGMAEIAREYAELGVAFTIVTLIMGNMIFFMLDRILDKFRFRT